MLLKRRRSDGTIEEEEVVHICVLCCKPVYMKERKHSHRQSKGIDYYAHESCVWKDEKKT